MFYSEKINSEDLTYEILMELNTCDGIFTAPEDKGIFCESLS